MFTENAAGGNRTLQTAKRGGEQARLTEWKLCALWRKTSRCQQERKASL